MGRSADKAGDSFDSLGKDASLLDRKISDTEQHLKDLITEFEKTDDVTLLKEVRKDHSTLSLLEKMRKELHGLEDDAERVGQKLTQSVETGFMNGLPASPVIIGSLVSAAAAAAPAIGAAVGGAVLGGVGIGGVVGGIFAAANDPRVSEAGAHLAGVFLGDLQGAGTPFIQPLLDGMDELEETSASFAATLHRAFADIAPTIGPLVKGVDGFVDALGPGLEDALDAAKPALRALGQELPEIGDAFSDMFSSIADGSDGATEGLITLLHITEDIIRGTGEFVGVMSDAYEWLVRVGNAETTVAAGWAETFSWIEKIPVAGQAFGLYRDGIEAMRDETYSLIEGLDNAKDASDDWDTSLRQLIGTTDVEIKALNDFSTALQDQFDPMANAVHRLNDVRDAQKNYTDAVKEHGRNSRQAKEAELELASAVLAADSAAAKAAAIFNGELSPALRQVLKDGHLTDKQIDDIEKQFRQAKAAGEAFAKTYKATAKLEFYEYRAGERNPSGKKAAGGPVMEGHSYVVGENGPEIVTMGGNGYVHDAATSRAMVAAGGAAAPAASPITVIVEPHVSNGGRGFEDFLMERIRYNVRVVGGGNVQDALGQSPFRTEVQRALGR